MITAEQARASAIPRTGLGWSSRLARVAVTAVLGVWMLAVVCGYLLMYMPPELKLFIQRLFGDDMASTLVTWQATLNRWMSTR